MDEDVSQSLNVGGDAAPEPWHAQVLTLFPEMFPGPLGVSLAGTAKQNCVWALETLDIRDFAANKHRSVDDTPAGGGAGMVLRADVLSRAIDAAAEHKKVPLPRIVLSPRGEPLTQALVEEFAAGPGVTLVCGRFEGIDERVIARRALREVSVGDVVLSGGEPAAIVLLDAIIRLLPGVIGARETLDEESFQGGLLEYPHYTRPREWEGEPIPEVLLSGNHAAIAKWRTAQRQKITRSRRPDLWQKYVRQNADLVLPSEHPGQSQGENRPGEQKEAKDKGSDP
ncbi:MAG: tRNA (guanosine(37)-N1)-methyltransferase TrmD [Pseudomonadota bacterium]